MGKVFRSFLIKKRSLLRLAFFSVVDAVLITVSVYLAFIVRFEAQIPSRYFLNIEGVILLALLITIPIFYFSRLYHFTWIYVSAGELISLVRATALSFLLLAASFFVLRDHDIFTGFPRSTLFITYFFIFILCGGIRFAKRVYLQASPRRTEGKERTLIVGAGDAGEQILRSILSFPFSPFLPVGFVDDNPAKQGILIHGMKVLGEIKDIPAIVKQEEVDGLVVALPSAGPEPIRRAVEQGRKAGLRKIKIVPSLDEIINGKISIGELKEVDMEDLLGRSPVVLDQKSIEDFIRDKRVLVTGAAGSIGSELSRQIIKFRPQHLFLLDQDETGIFNIENEIKSNFSQATSLVADIRDEKKIKGFFRATSPQLVFHAAAYKHVPLMERYPEEAVKNNVLGTKVVAEAALENETEKFIFVSTDKAVNPSSVMGATKRIGEMFCQALSLKGSTKFISVRFGNVLGSRGSVIPVFKEKIKKRETIEITHSEMKRYFMTTPEACLLVMQAGAMGQGGEVFVLDMGDPVRIMDLARSLIRLSGLEPDKDIPVVFSEPRPGEKFFEEILTAEEGTLATQNQKIFIAKLSQSDQGELNSGMERLIAAADNNDKEAIIKSLKNIISNYNHG